MADASERTRSEASVAIGAAAAAALRASRDSADGRRGTATSSYESGNHCSAGQPYMPSPTSTVAGKMRHGTR
jgi:hypothetical protein